jgi:hypothetical protein
MPEDLRRTDDAAFDGRDGDQDIVDASKIRAFHNPHHSALCVLTDTTDLARAVRTRCAFENTLAVARSGAWALYWDPEADPDFPVRAKREGQLIGSLEAGAIWHHPLGGEFLVLCPQIEVIKVLPIRVEQVAGPAGSGVRQRVGQSPLGVPLRASA